MSTNEERPYRRHILFISKTYQRNFILKFCAVALCAMVLATLLLYVFSTNSVTATYRYHHLALRETARAILPAMIITNAIILLSFLVATVILTLYVSHKIGGPLHRLGKSLESIGEGNLKSRIHLREYDQLQDLAMIVNRMTENLNTSVRKIQKDVVEIEHKSKRGSNMGEIKKDMESLHSTVFQLFETE